MLDLLKPPNYKTEASGGVVTTVGYSFWVGIVSGLNNNGFPIALFPTQTPISELHHAQPQIWGRILPNAVASVLSKMIKGTPDPNMETNSFPARRSCVV